MSASIGRDVQHARQLLARGELVAIPTETVYGLAGNATDPNIVAHIFEVKQRPQFDPLIVHIGAKADAKRYATSIPAWAEKLSDAFWPGPLTMVLQKRDLIPDIVTAGLGTVGLRMPNHPLTLELLSELPFPLAAPSANPFGYVSPTSAKHVFDQLGSQIPYILDGGDCKVGIESTIVGEVSGEPVILRLGGLSVEEIREVIGHVAIFQKHLDAQKASPAPGMLSSHYAPRKQVILGEPETIDPKQMGALRFRSLIEGIPAEHQVVLSPRGDLREAATHLFGAMRHLDGLPITTIYAELVPDTGIGRAINDRLKRASVRRKDQ